MATKHVKDVHGSNEISPPTAIPPIRLAQVELSGDDDDDEGGVQHITVGIDDVVRVMPWFCIEVSLVFEISVAAVGKFMDRAIVVERRGECHFDVFVVVPCQRYHGHVLVESQRNLFAC